MEALEGSAESERVGVADAGGDRCQGQVGADQPVEQGRLTGLLPRQLRGQQVENGGVEAAQFVLLSLPGAVTRI